MNGIIVCGVLLLLGIENKHWRIIGPGIRAERGTRRLRNICAPPEMYIGNTAAKESFLVDGARAFTGANIPEHPTAAKLTYGNIAG
jgi:hypothetical protein